MSWIEDEVSDADDGASDEPDVGDEESFESQIRAVLAAGNADSMSEELLNGALPSVEDTDLLERLEAELEDESKRQMAEDRLVELGAWDYTDEDDEIDSGEVYEEMESSDADEVEESGDTDTVDLQSLDADDFEQEVREAVLDDRVDEILDAIEERADELPGEVQEKVQEVSDDVRVLEMFDTDDEEEEEDSSSESVFDQSGSDDESDESSEVESNASDPEPETAQSDSQPAQSGNAGDGDNDDPENTVLPEEVPDGTPDWKSSFDSAASGSSGIDVAEAAQLENRWSLLVWSDPGKGKTHFGYSAKEPVCIIDTEGKADHLAKKFSDKTVRLFQPSEYDEALDALHDALDLLHEVYENHGRIGTLVVDSMSIMWEWSQQKYVDKFYRGKDVDEVEFSSAIGSGGQSDWKQIKRYHNVQFRQAIIDSPFHFVWTAMAADDYEAAIENDLNFTPQKPSGEKDNEYKASEVLRLRENEKGVTVGELEKSDKIDHHYTGLRKPDFPKHKEVVEAIAEAEAGERSIQSVESEFDVEVFEGNPRTARIAEEA